MTTAVAIYAPYLKDIPMPPSIRRLPLCPVRGVPVPWFVAWIDGVPEFRCADPVKFAIAVQQRRCWACGDPLSRNEPVVFLLGPMCVVNRVTSEPPCHHSCAEFSARACPFLTKPHMVRREAGLPEEAANPGGLMIERNPGVVALYAARKYELFKSPGGGRLFHLSGPAWVRWVAEGCPASRRQVLDSIESGYSILLREAQKDGPVAVEALAKIRRVAEQYLPGA